MEKRDTHAAKYNSNIINDYLVYHISAPIMRASMTGYSKNAEHLSW